MNKKKIDIGQKAMAAPEMGGGGIEGAKWVSEGVMFVTKNAENGWF